MEELFVGGRKVLVPLAWGILLVSGFTATASNNAELALLCSVDSSVPIAQQLQEMADCITAIGTNFRRLADAIHVEQRMSSSNAAGSANASSPPPTPQTTTTVSTPATPPPRLIHQECDTTPPSAPPPRLQQISWLRWIVENLCRVAERHLFFSMVTGCVILVTIMVCFAALVMPRLFDAIERRSPRGRVLFSLGLISAIVLVAWTVDSLWQALY
ncbi:uncharacterized protein LOC129581099 [Paramacrobiotus metropolitanus]|uniref:uncharacterized protein LOC129581099 n=1 Tax=Paramacrobiotus metropolitanus TaxID=2943436 RepID=UPI00244588F7|nr:uncharacterized protein LOC129581099 [Paramacrobiotus metropolitanus]